MSFLVEFSKYEEYMFESITNITSKYFYVDCDCVDYCKIIEYVIIKKKVICIKTCLFVAYHVYP